MSTAHYLTEPGAGLDGSTAPDSCEAAAVPQDYEYGTLLVQRQTILHNVF